jgi:hypothetical protein
LLPLSFEANRGQTDPRVKFLSRGNGYSLFLTDSAAVLTLTKGGPSPRSKLDRLGLAGKKPTVPAKPAKTDVVRMELAGASHGLQVTGAEQLPGTANYFIGNDPGKWRSNVPTYAKVKYAGVYPGVDLVYYGNHSQLEYDFVVDPHADAKSIKLHFAGAKKLSLDSDGDLRVIAKDGEVSFHKPVVYQEINGLRHPLEGGFKLLATTSIGFTLGSYDRNTAIVIDPTLAYSTYIGGGGGTAIALDSAGSAYVTGTTSFADLSTTGGAYQPTYPGQSNGQQNVFVTKLSADGNTLVYSTYLGGSQSISSGDTSYGIVIDAGGNAYICGATSSPDFPTSPAAFQTTNKTAAAGVASPFVTKLNPSGTALIYSTFIGGSGGSLGKDEGASSIAVDSSGNAYITGLTYSTDFPTKSPYQAANAGMGHATSNAFATKLNVTGNALLYSTFLGGSGAANSDGDYNGDGGTSIAVDSNGEIFVAGATFSTDFPVNSAYQSMSNATPGYSNGFITKFGATGTSLIIPHTLVVPEIRIARIATIMATLLEV